MGKGAWGLLGVLCALAVAPALSSASPRASVLPVTQRVAARSYADLMVAAWQERLAHGHAYVAGQARAWSCIAPGQHGRVWFLVDEYEGDAPVTATCSVPAGRYLYLEGPAFGCSTVEAAPFGASLSGLSQCAASFLTAGASVSVDGRALPTPAYHVATPVFGFAMPASDNVLKVTGQTHGDAAAQGEVTVLRPLTAGRHTIVQIAHFIGGVAVQTTWRVKIA